MDSQLTEPTQASVSAHFPNLLDDLQRVHVQLGLLEYRTAMNEHADSYSVRRLSELGDDVKQIMERLESEQRGYYSLSLKSQPDAKARK